MQEEHPSPGTPPMPENQTIPAPPEPQNVPDDLREFVKRMAADGIAATPSNLPPGYQFPEPIRANTSLSDAIIEERDEYGR